MIAKRVAEKLVRKADTFYEPPLAKKPKISELEALVQDEINNQTNNTYVAARYGGSELYISGEGSMDKEDWRSFAADLCDIIDRETSLKYEFSSSWDRGMILATVTEGETQKVQEKYDTSLYS